MLARYFTTSYYVAFFLLGSLTLLRRLVGFLFFQVASWWDYGYQTTAMANRTVIVDNNTWNNTHIATVGTAMSSPEKAAWEIFNSLDVKYVLVVFGGLFTSIFPQITLHKINKH